MLNYISQKEYCVGCRFRPAPNTIPRPDDFKRVYFKINDVTYFEWSDEFAKLAEADRMWRKLQYD